MINIPTWRDLAFWNTKNRYIIYLTNEVGGVNNAFKRKELSSKEQILTLNDSNRAIINFNSPMFKIKNKYFYCYDVTHGQIYAHSLNEKDRTDLISLLTKKGTLSGIVSSLKMGNNSMFSLAIGLIIIIMGIAVGFIIGNIAPISAIQHFISNFHW